MCSIINKQYFCRIPLLLSELSDAKLMKDAQTPDPPLCGRNGKTNTMQAGGAVKIPLGKAKETEIMGRGAWACRGEGVFLQP